MKHVAIVAIIRHGKLLMGRRKDNGKWTNPGGHLNPKEHPLEGAIREVQEETGMQLTPNLLHPIATAIKEDKGLTIHAFKVDLDMAGKQPSTVKIDPDEECHRWHWISIKSGMNPDIWNNLHVPYSDNIILQHLGVYMGVEKSEFYIDLNKSSTGEGSRGGHIVGHTKGGDPIYGSPATPKHTTISDDEIPKGWIRITDRLVESHDDHEFAGNPHLGGETFSISRSPKDGSYTTQVRIPGLGSAEGVRSPLSENSYSTMKDAVHSVRYPGFAERARLTNYHNRDNGSRGGHIIGHTKSEKLIGGLADGKPDSEFPEDKLKAGMKVEQEHTDDKEKQKEITKDHLAEDEEYYIKLKKIEKSGTEATVSGRPHKYLRKYRKGGGWIYIYHEGDTHRRLHPDEAALLHRAAANPLSSGHAGAKKLVDTTEEVHQDMLALLKRMSAHHEGAKREYERHKAILGDDLDEVIKPRSEVEIPFTEAVKAKVKSAIEAGMEVGFRRLRENSTSTPTKRFEEHGITKESLMAEIDMTSLKTTLESMHTAFKKADVAHEGLTLQFSEAVSAGGYGNLMYQRSIKELEDNNILPSGYSEIHARGGEIHAPSKIAEQIITQRRERAEQAARELATRREREARELTERTAREARERAAREEQDRRDAAGLVDTIGYKMVQMTEGLSSSDRVRTAKAFNKMTREIFGKDLPSDAFPYEFPGSGITVKIQEVNINDHSIFFHLQAYNQYGEELTERWTRRWDIVGGRPHIYNDLLKVREDAKGGAKIGHLVNESQRKFIKDHAGPGGGTVTVTAALSVGPYMWCNTGFSYKDDYSRGKHVNCLKIFLRETGQSLSDAQIALFTEPCHFAAFDDGNLYELKLRNKSKLTPKQIETGYLDGVVGGKWKLTAMEMAEAKTLRMAVNAGKYLLLKEPDNSSWYGIWDSKKDTTATKYAVEYARDKKSALRLLGDKFLNLFQRSMSFYIDLFKAGKGAYHDDR